ncbi:MAG: hypothetical protein LBD51_04880 [Bifidobacteriaceae bacterium]|nr:hypothetical protein [Bifidobacteriaceae bacterium]
MRVRARCRARRPVRAVALALGLALGLAAALGGVGLAGAAGAAEAPVPEAPVLEAPVPEAPVPGAPVPETPAAESRPAAGSAAEPPLVLIGTTGLAWADVSAAETPALWELIAGGAAGAGLANRSARAGACPAEGWLAVGAGARVGEVEESAAAERQAVDAASCWPLAEPVAGRIPGWEELTASAVAAGQPLGALADWLAQMEVSAGGIGPGAALALADESGRVAASYAAAPAADAELGRAVGAALAGGGRLLVVDAGTRSEELGPAQLDARVGAVLEAAAGHAGGARVLVASLADWGAPALGVVLERELKASAGPPAVAQESPAEAAGAGPPRLIESAATKTAGLALATELAQVIEARLVPAPVGPLDPWAVGGALAGPEELRERLADANSHAAAAREWTAAAWVIVMVVAALGAFGPLVARGGAARAPRAGRRVEFLALAAGAFPAAGLAANAVPWWRCGLPLAVWAGCAAVLAALSAALGAAVAAASARRCSRPAGERRDSRPLGAGGQAGRQATSPLLPAAVIGLVSALIVGLDPFIGRVFTRDAPLGVATLLAARLYGFTNPTFAVFATGAVLAAVLVAGAAWARGRRLGAAWPIAAVGAAALVIDAYPAWGADLGGAVGIGAAFAVMALMAADVRVNWRWAAAAVLAGVAAAGVIAWLDHQRGPGQWTHLGAFVETVAGGGLWDVIGRKALMALRLSIGPAVGLVAAGLIAVGLARRGAFGGLRAKAWSRAPLLKPMLAGLVTLWALGSAVNDSGLIVAVTGLAVAAPALSAALTRAARPA